MGKLKHLRTAIDDIRIIAFQRDHTFYYRNTCLWTVDREAVRRILGNSLCRFCFTSKTVYTRVAEICIHIS